MIIELEVAGSGPVVRSAQVIESRSEERSVAAAVGLQKRLMALGLSEDHEARFRWNG